MEGLSQRCMPAEHQCGQAAPFAFGSDPHLGCCQVLGHLCQQPVHHSAWRAAVIFPQDVLQLAVRLRSVTLGTGIGHILLCPCSRGAARCHPSLCRCAAGAWHPRDRGTGPGQGSVVGRPQLTSWSCRRCSSKFTAQTGTGLSTLPLSLRRVRLGTQPTQAKRPGRKEQSSCRWCCLEPGPSIRPALGGTLLQPHSGGGLRWHMCGQRGEGREPSPCWGTGETMVGGCTQQSKSSAAGTS